MAESGLLPVITNFDNLAPQQPVHQYLWNPRDNTVEQVQETYDHIFLPIMNPENDGLQIRFATTTLRPASRNLYTSDSSSSTMIVCNYNVQKPKEIEKTRKKYFKRGRPRKYPVLSSSTDTDRIKIKRGKRGRPRKHFRPTEENPNEQGQISTNMNDDLEENNNSNIGIDAIDNDIDQNNLNIETVIMKLDDTDTSEIDIRVETSQNPVNRNRSESVNLNPSPQLMPQSISETAVYKPGGPGDMPAMPNLIPRPKSPTGPRKINNRRKTEPRGRKKSQLYDIAQVQPYEPHLNDGANDGSSSRATISLDNIISDERRSRRERKKKNLEEYATEEEDFDEVIEEEWEDNLDEDYSPVKKEPKTKPTSNIGKEFRFQLQSIGRAIVKSYSWELQNKMDLHFKAHQKHLMLADYKGCAKNECGWRVVWSSRRSNWTRNFLNHLERHLPKQVFLCNLCERRISSACFYQHFQSLHRINIYTRQFMTSLQIKMFTDDRRKFEPELEKLLEECFPLQVGPDGRISEGDDDPAPLPVFALEMDPSLKCKKGRPRKYKSVFGRIPDLFLAEIEKKTTALDKPPTLICMKANCNYFCKTFNAAAMEKHVLSHANRKGFVCQSCGKTFLQHDPHFYTSLCNRPAFQDLRKDFEPLLIQILDECFP